MSAFPPMRAIKGQSSDLTINSDMIRETIIVIIIIIQGAIKNRLFYKNIINMNIIKASCETSIK